MADWISATITGLSDLLGGGLNSVYSAAAAKKQYEYNLALQKQAQKHQINMYKHQNQWRVEDLRAAGLNPILSTHAASSMPSSGMNSVSMPHSANFDFKDSSKAIARALFKRGQKEDKLLDAQINSAKAKADSDVALAKKYAADAKQTEAFTPPTSKDIYNKSKDIFSSVSSALGQKLGDTLFDNKKSDYAFEPEWETRQLLKGNDGRKGMQWRKVGKRIHIYK